LLAANAQLFSQPNVTLINAAASDRCGVAEISIPEFVPGLTNYYQARLGANGGGLFVLTVPLDTLAFDQRISLVKIDVEGHEAAVLAGMQQLIRTSKPTLIVETNSDVLVAQLQSLGYSWQRLPGSSNVLLRADR
jgi:FkbM family methyltransferase